MGVTEGYNALIKGRIVVVYGTGKNSYACMKLLSAINTKFDYFTNSKITSDEGFHFCYPLISSKKLNPKEHFVVISVKSDIKSEIAELLINKGFEYALDYIHYIDLSDPFIDISYEGVKIGKYSYGFKCYDFVIKNNFVESIGRFCSFNERAYAHINHTQLISQSQRFYRMINSDICAKKAHIRRAKKLVIGNDVWVGANSFINIESCHCIGDGAIIGAGAIVTHDVPPYAVVVGVPARILKYRFSPEQIDILLRIKWWARKEDWLRENKIYFEDIDLFFEHFSEHTPPDDTLDEQIL